MKLEARSSARDALLLAAGCALVAACTATGAVAAAQQLIGYVNTRDADVTGASDVLNGQAVLTAAASVAARDHTAPITLGRGGSVRVCQTSKLRLTQSRSLNMAAPLLFSLDHGAIEIQMAGTLNDSIMTPDLRFTIVNAGPLDLRLRVAGNGDTCVENRGPAAPTLTISDAFGETAYQVSAGQHVLFEHGSLREVVDHERTPCGCPDQRGLSVADALLASGGAKNAAAPAPAPLPTAVPLPAPIVAAPGASPAAQAAEAHPFPAAISEGLAPVPEVPQAPPGQVHAQVSDTLSYDAGKAAPASAAGGARAAAPVGASAAPPAAPVSHHPLHAVGRFFRWIFMR